METLEAIHTRRSIRKYEDAERGSIWAEAGAAAMTGPLDLGVGDHELDAARRLGGRLARKLRSD